MTYNCVLHFVLESLLLVDFIVQFLFYFVLTQSYLAVSMHHVVSPVDQISHLVIPHHLWSMDLFHLKLMNILLFTNLEVADDSAAILTRSYLFVGTHNNWFSRSAGHIQQWQWSCCWMYDHGRKDTKRLWYSSHSEEKNGSCWYSCFLETGEGDC